MCSGSELYSTLGLEIVLAIFLYNFMLDHKIINQNLEKGLSKIKIKVYSDQKIGLEKRQLNSAELGEINCSKFLCNSWKLKLLLYYLTAVSLMR